MDPTSHPEIYISADIETDGPYPGRYSMLSFGLAAVATYDGGTHVARLDPRSHAAYWELRPESETFDPEALAVNGLDRERLRRSGMAAPAAMTMASRWVSEIAGDNRPVMVAYPVAFDWLFLHRYFMNFCGESPFGHGSCIDIRSLYIGATGSTYRTSSKKYVPEKLQPAAAHTHHALDDAIEQGQLFVNILEFIVDRGR
jgi:DNA polymerase III epsilon subunit-like protein